MSIEPSPLYPTTVTVTCTPNSVYVSEPTNCRAHVNGSNPTGSVLWGSSSGSQFTLASCTLSGGNCTVSYVDSWSGTPTLTASYQGDAHNAASSGTEMIQVVTGSSTSATTVSCSPTPVFTDTMTNCTASVGGSSPTGNVTFAASPGVTFVTPPTCQLNLTGENCSVEVNATAQTNMTVDLTAMYSGDIGNLPSNNSTLLSVVSIQTLTTVDASCTPDPAIVNQTTTCTAKLAGLGQPASPVPGTRADPTPTGQVYWWSIALATGLSGNLNTSYCTLVNGSCSITFVPTSDGSWVEVPSYLGDEYNAATTPHFNINVTGAATFATTFTESGLPAATNWSVTLNGTTKSSSTSTIQFSEPDGSYRYSVAPISGYIASPSSGTDTVNGTAVHQAITFSPPSQYPVTFSESGLAAETSWSVTLNGSSLSSITTTIAFSEPNYTYSFTIGTVSGYRSNVTSGSIKVSGSPEIVLVSFTLTSSGGNGGGSSSSFGGLSTMDWAIIGAVVVIVVAAGVAFGMRGRRRGGATAPLSQGPPQSPPKQT